MTIEQGEIWMVTFYPQVGSEITKLRPAVVVSHNTIGRLPLKTIVPITDWKPNYTHYPWMLQLKPDHNNVLSKISAVDCFQIKNFSDARFVERVSSIDAATLKKIHETVAKTLNPLYALM